MRPPPPPPTTLLRRLRAPATTRRAVHTGLRSVPAWFVRGGTSNGLVLRAADLPPAGRWPLILPAVMGSPDAHHARQLDGMGSGVSSTSKLVVLSETTTTCHVAYTFVQIGIRDGAVDTAGNCGNMSSIVGPAAWDMGYVSAAAKASLVTTAADGTRWATVRLLNTNTDKVVESTFCVDGGGAAYCPAGDYVMDGVPGAHSPVTMRFLDPAGAKTGRALPTARAVDTLLLPDDDGRGCAAVRASLVDVGNPGVFVAGASVGLDAPVAPAAIEADAPLKARLEALRRQGAALMGMDPDTESVPKIVLVFPAEDAAAEADLRCQAMSMGQAHKAVPLTLALCLGAAARIEGTLPWRMMRDAGRPEDAETVRIAHPSGLVDVGTTIVDGEIRAAKLLRTARVLMKGDVFY